MLEDDGRRIRPILMTALATILGLLPLALGFGEGNETMVPLARAVVGGLAVKHDHDAAGRPGHALSWCSIDGERVPMNIEESTQPWRIFNGRTVPNGSPSNQGQARNSTFDCSCDDVSPCGHRRFLLIRRSLAEVGQPVPPADPAH